MNLKIVGVAQVRSGYQERGNRVTWTDENKNAGGRPQQTLDVELWILSFILKIMGRYGTPEFHFPKEHSERGRSVWGG